MHQKLLCSSFVSAFMTRKRAYFYPWRFDTLQTHILRSRGFDVYVPAVLSSQCTFRVNPAIILIILNPLHVILSAAKNLVVMLRTGSVKDLVTA
jgi:hypothetical protein